MKKFCCLISLGLAMNLSAQTAVVKDSVKSISLGAIVTARPAQTKNGILIGNRCVTCRVLTIYDQKQYFSHDVKSTLDTLYARYDYVLHFDRDSIARYTTNPNIQNVIIVTRSKQ